jgi:membrane protease YdiL (CAAX protease family)
MAPSRVQRLWSWLITPPTEQIVDEDRRTTDLVGLRLPVRASIVVVVTTMVLLIDFSRVLLPGAVVQLGRAPDGLRAIALERVVLFALVPLAVILLGFRDRPARYGWTLVLWFATLPDVRAYYAVSAAPPQDIVLTNVIDLTTAEFLFRGFLMLTLVRAIGPIGVLIAVMPFAFAHVGKPALELLSTLGGGLAYGWLAWRTRSIVWGSIAHVYILSLLTLAAAR